jgi:hypothetical protein
VAFSDNEIWVVVFDLNPNNAPGPDGFTALFIQTCWDTIKMDLSAVVLVVQGLSSHQFHRLNAATKVLITKKLDVSSPKVFSL